MPTRSKLMLAGLTAALFMAVAVGSASARNFRITNNSFRAIWNPLTFQGGGLEARCPVTLEGTFHSTTIAKVARTLIGFVTRAISGAGAACARGSSTVRRETLPWHVTYEGFTGTLPNITGIRILLRGSSFQVDPGIGVSCRYGHPEENASGIINVVGGVAQSITAETGIRLRGFGEFFCPEEGGFTGTTSSLTVLGAATRITVTLI